MKESGDISINSAFETLKNAKRERLGLNYCIKKGKQESDRKLKGQKPPNCEKICEQTRLKLLAKDQKIDRDVDIIKSQAKELERLKQQQKKPIQQHATTTIEEEVKSKKQDKWQEPREEILEDDDDEDILNQEIELIEKIAGLSFSQIRKMSVDDFLARYREFHIMNLKLWIDQDVHQQAQVLNYLLPMVRDMVEVTERERTILRQKERSRIGDV